MKCIDDEIPFDIPKGWEWCRLRSIVYNHGQITPSASFSYIDIGSINNTDLCLNSRETVLSAKEAPSRARKIVRLGDILYSTVRPYLHNMCIIDRQFSETPIASTGFAVMTCYQGVLNKYLFLFLQSPQFDQYANDGDNAKGVAYPAINDQKLYNALIALPPEEEQKRISSTFNTLIPSLSKYGIAQHKLDLLNCQISEKIKKSILQDAIQGKLVPQNPNDEPASVLLNQIRAEKQRLLKEGKLKKKDITDSIIFKGDDNKYYERIGTETAEIDLPFSFPESWAIVRLHSICALIDGEKRAGSNICLDAKYLRGKSSGEQMTAGRFVHSGDNIILVDGENSGEVFTVPVDGYMGSTFKQLWVSETLHLPYVLACIRFYKDELRNSKKGAAIPHLNKDIFRNLIIGVPPLNEQLRMTKAIDEIMSFL